MVRVCNKVEQLNIRILTSKIHNVTTSVMKKIFITPTLSHVLESSISYVAPIGHTVPPLLMVVSNKDPHHFHMCPHHSSLW